MKKALIALLVCMIASPAFAETRYQIEVLIFTQPPLSDSEPPDQRPEHSAPAFPREIAWPLRPPGTRGVGPEALPASDHRFSGTANRLRNQPGYTLIWHEAWQQTLRGSRSAPAISLPSSLRPLGIEARIRPYRQRFLHFEVDVRWHIAAADTAEPTAFWRLAQSRRMRSGQTHYLDHPVLGVIVRIDPVATP